MRGRLALPLWPIAGALALLALLFVFALELRGARAQESVSDGRVERELALAIAKVAANEASLTRVRPAEVALVHQVTEARASTASARLSWLTRHSSCVLTDRPMSEVEARGNCRWSRNLGDNDDEPEGWPDGPAWPRFAPRWAQVRAFALMLVSGERDARPCSGGTPFSWGGPMDRDQALARGLVPLRCVDEDGEPTLNTAYALARDAT